MTGWELSIEEEFEVDALAREFEDLVREGRSPALVDFVEAAPPRLRERLDRELRLLQEEFETKRVSVDATTVFGPAPERIGRYRIVREIGRGGMGAVYEAIQEQPRRTIALKVVRPDLISADLRQRFGREVRLLGRLQHPGIASVLEAGAAPLVEGGPNVPYLALEYIDGLPLLEHCQRNALPLRERLQLLIQVTDAIHYAHEQGIVHRDLKSANVLVARGTVSRDSTVKSASSAAGRPIVLDFGVARVMGSAGSGTLETGFGQLLGTLSHMSPEQLEGDPSAVDGRADVYALGVMLFELAAGHLPIPLDGLSAAQAVERLRTAEPMRLGARAPELRGDLETIAAKALARDPGRRYATAAEFGADLQRFLDDEPIRARPATLAYQLRKFARRNPALAASTVTAVALLFGTLAVVSSYAVEQSRLRIKAQEATELARQEAETARAVAEYQKRYIERANLDKGGNPRDLRLVDVLASAGAELDRAFPDQPRTEQELRRSLGEALQSLGEAEVALQHLLRSHALAVEWLGPDHKETLAATVALGTCYERLGRYDEAEAQHRVALEQALRRADENPQQAARALSNLATVLEATGRVQEAVETYERSLTLLGDDPEKDLPVRASCLNNLATAYERLERFEEAETTYIAALELRRRLHAAPHAFIANSLNNLGALYVAVDRTDDAAPYLEEALAMRIELLGEEHPIVTASRTNLAALQFRRGRLDEAEHEFRRCLAIFEATAGPDSQEARVIRSNLAQVRTSQGDHAEALELDRAVQASVERVLHALHPDALRARFRAAKSLFMLGRIDEAEAELAALLEIDDPAILKLSVHVDALRAYARCAVKKGDDALAVARFERMVEACTQHRGPLDEATIEGRVLLAEFLAGRGRGDEARAAAAAALEAALEADASGLATRARALAE